LANAYLKKEITLDMALSRSSNADELQDMINRGAATPGSSKAPAGKR
jgi:hypothetical protein